MKDLMRSPIGFFVLTVNKGLHGRVLLGFLALALIAGQVEAVTINEIRIDQPGADNSEYFELAGDAGESLANVWYVVLGDTGAGTSGANGFGNSGVVEAAVDLSGFSIPADGFFLAVENSFQNGAGEIFEGIVADISASFSFENNDNVTHLLVRDFTGATGNDLDTNDDGTLDSTPWSSVLDGVGLLETPAPSASGEEWLYAVALGGSNIGPNDTSVPNYVFRDPNGTGAFRIGEPTLTLGEVLDTPGVANVTPPVIENADFNGDSIVDAADYTIWRDNLGNPGGPGDANGIDGVTAADYAIWKAQFGTNPNGAGALIATSSTNVPEPSSLVLLGLAGLFGLSQVCCRRRAGY